MMHRKRTLGCLVIIVISSLESAPSADSYERGQSISATATRIISLMDTIADHHLSPPTHQQMLLLGSQAAFRSEIRLAAPENVPYRQWLAPAGLSSRISKLASSDEFHSYLIDLLGQCERIDKAEAVFTGAVVGTLAGGGRIIDAKEDQVEEQVRANRYVGIGISIGLDQASGLPQIPRVFYDGPAWRAGIRNSDLIVEINGQSTVGKDLGTVVEELRGEEGSNLSVIVRQPAADELRAKELTRRRVFIPTVEGLRQEDSGKWIYQLDAAPGIAYMKLASIGPSTLHELRKLANELSKAETSGLILDLRAGGGTLHDTIVVADSLLDGGLIGYVQKPDGTVPKVARTGNLFGEQPMVVLIGPATSGGNSFLAAALQDSGRAVLVGSPPQAAAFVNSVIDLPDRDEKLMLAVGLLLRADGTPLLNGMLRSLVIDGTVADQLGSQAVDAQLQRSVLRPDHTVEQEPGDQSHFPQGNGHHDSLLRKAVEVLRADHESQPN